mmetsp:Transcript_33871/g.99823  ORF Transcript_33871/g.99823 Transcript_33871/m.99823 type:complete len:268 (+) Transcript_33871:64-867(+)
MDASIEGKHSPNGGAAEEQNVFPAALKEGEGPTTILAYGALLSESSARLTFPHLNNFRLVRVRGYRRVFGHPHLFLIGQNVVDLADQSLRLASLSAEKVVTSDYTSPAEEEAAGFVVAAFDVELDDAQRKDFVERERAYEFAKVPYYDIDSDCIALPKGRGVICLAGSNDAKLPQVLDPVVSKIREELGQGVWHWEHDSGLLPADVYLRHCLLAVEKAGPIAMNSFVNETYFADRNTTVAEYLDRDNTRERVMLARPPDHLLQRFNG